MQSTATHWIWVCGMQQTETWTLGVAQHCQWSISHYINGVQTSCNMQYAKFHSMCVPSWFYPKVHAKWDLCMITSCIMSKCTVCHLSRYVTSIPATGARTGIDTQNDIIALLETYIYTRPTTITRVSSFVPSLLSSPILRSYTFCSRPSGSPQHVKGVV